MQRLIFLLGVFLAGAAHADGYLPLWSKAPPTPTDMVLIYQGGHQRPQWTTNRFAPYVTYTDPQTGRQQWLFDGFLFIEFADGRHHTFEPGIKNAPARKMEWQDLLERNFATNDGIPMLEATCVAAADRLGQPSRPRQVALTIPVPIPGQTDWGQINGHSLDFRNADDRLAACEWYMDTALKKWRELAPKELKLTGFYWLAEGAAGTNAFLQSVAQEVHRRGKAFLWIPYWQPKTGAAALWRANGFDAAWQQPNYFFHTNVTQQRLQAACNFARRNGMGLEMEFDGRTLSDSGNFAPRLGAYLEAFEKDDVKTRSSVAWYEGGGALYELAVSRDPEIRRYYTRVARFVLARQHEADTESAAGR